MRQGNYISCFSRRLALLYWLYHGVCAAVSCNRSMGTMCAQQYVSSYQAHTAAATTGRGRAMAKWTFSLLSFLVPSVPWANTNVPCIDHVYASCSTHFSQCSWPINTMSRLPKFIANPCPPAPPPPRPKENTMQFFLVEYFLLINVYKCILK